jgi:glycosyltransferase involved in cell wall biosynthesis
VAYLGYYRAAALGSFLWRLMRWFYNRCDVTLPPSVHTQRELESRGFNNVRVWGRGIDTELFSPLRRDPGVRARMGADDETPVLLMVSRLVKEKDLHDLIDMNGILRARGLKYRMAIVGEGPYRRVLEKGLPEAVFSGLLVGEELARWYASGDIFVFPSTTETFGNVVQESMASGLATVVVNRGGPPELLEAGASGLVAQANDPRDLADKVAGLIANPALRHELGANARRVALTRPWKVINANLIAEYDALAGHGHTRRRP